MNEKNRCNPIVSGCNSVRTAVRSNLLPGDVSQIRVFVRSSIISSFSALAILLGISAVPLTSEAVHAQEVDSRIEKIVRVENERSFNSIALEEFGTVGMARLLAEYNQLAPDADLAAGTEIIIPTHLEPKKNFATVAYVKGGATLHVAGSRNTIRELAADFRVYSTDEIVTAEDGFVSLLLSNGSVLNIQPSSTLSLKILQCLPDNPACNVELGSSSGSVDADVKKRTDQQNRFLISTPYASAAVRGTKFDFGASTDELLVGVTHGEVEVAAGQSAASLPAGFGARTANGEAPGEAVELLKAPTLNAAPQRFTSEDIVAWNEVNGAASYQISVSADASGQQEIYRQSVSELIHPVNPLPPGDAYVTIRPVDRQNLKGFHGRQRLNIVELDAELPKPVLLFENEDASDSVFVFSGNAATDELPLEVQFSETPEFAQLVSVDIPANGGAKHSLSGDTNYYARARVVTNGSVVGGYGDVLEIPARN